MNSAIAISNSLQHGREAAALAPAAEQGAPLDRSLLLVLLLAAAAWLVPISIIWLVWQLLT